MEYLDTLVKISQAGSTVLLLVVVYGAIKGFWVPRWLYDEGIKREAALWVLYERERATSERLLAQATTHERTAP